MITSAIFSHMSSLFCNFTFFFSLNMHTFGVHSHEIFHFQQREVWQSRLFFTCCHGESCYLHSIDKAFWISGHECNSDSEFIKPTLNNSESSQNSDISELGNPEVVFQLWFLKTLFLKPQVPPLSNSLLLFIRCCHLGYFLVCPFTDCAVCHWFITSVLLSIPKHWTEERERKEEVEWLLMIFSLSLSWHNADVLDKSWMTPPV